MLDVRFKLPADVFENEGRRRRPRRSSVNIQDGSDAEAIVRPIPLVTKTLKVEFFPEGGEMVEGVPGRVYFMVRTRRGIPPNLCPPQSRASRPLQGSPRTPRGHTADRTPVHCTRVTDP